MRRYSKFQQKLHHLSIRSRLFSIVLVFAIPFSILIYSTIDNIKRNIVLAQMEIDGVKYEKILTGILAEIGNHRLTRMIIAHNKDPDRKILKKHNEYSKNIDALIDELIELNKNLGTDLRFSKNILKNDNNEATMIEELAQKWQVIKNQDITIYNNYDEILVLLDRIITVVGDTSGLILDPDLDSYYLMDISVNQLPQTINRISYASFLLYPYFNLSIPVSPEISSEAKLITHFLREAEMERVLFDIDLAFNEDENFYGVSQTLKPNLEPVIEEYKNDMNQFITTLDIVSSGNRIAPDTLSKQIFKLRDFIKTMNYKILDELTTLLNKRIEYYQNKQWNTLIWYALAQLIGLWLFFFLTTSVITPINWLYKALVEITKGNLRIKIPGKDFQDEIGTIARGIESFRINLLEKVELETELKEKSNYLQSITDSSFDGIMVINSIGTILDFNKSAGRIFGYNIDDIKGENISILLPQKTSSRYRKYIESYLSNISNMTGVNREIKGTKKNGDIFPIEITISKLDYHEDTLFVVMVKDITYRKKIEAELIEHRDHLQKLVDIKTLDLIIEKEKAEKANVAKSEFLSNMSHELRTPMHAILNYTSMSIKNISGDTIKNPEKLDKYLNNIQMAGKRLLGLLNNLLDFEKLEAGKMTFSIEKGDLQKVIDYALVELDSLIKNKKLSVTKENLCQNTNIYLDEAKLIQVIINLLSNSIKFSPEGGNITIIISDYAEKDGKEFVLCSISDDGIGIPTEELEDIFDKFTQSSKTKTMSGGTGLGLSISRKIIEGHQGKIWAENMKAGAAIKFILPKTP
ncbi:MAG: ATP-binding protein [Rickettsiales bacterium]